MWEVRHTYSCWIRRKYRLSSESLLIKKDCRGKWYLNKVVKITLVTVFLGWTGNVWLCSFNVFSRFSWTYLQSKPIFLIFILFSINHSNVYSLISWWDLSLDDSYSALKAGQKWTEFPLFHFFLWDWSHLIIETIFLTSTAGFVPYFLGAGFACEHFLPRGLLMKFLCCTYFWRQTFLVSGCPVLGSLWVWRCPWRDRCFSMSHQQQWLSFWMVYPEERQRLLCLWLWWCTASSGFQTTFVFLWKTGEKKIYSMRTLLLFSALCSSSFWFPAKLETAFSHIFLKL